MRVVLDTHAAIWYLSEDRRLPPKIFRLLDAATDQGEAITISAISLVEMIYLIERGRIVPDTYDRLVFAVRSENSSWLIQSVDASVAELMKGQCSRYARSHYRGYRSSSGTASCDRRSTHSG